MECYKGAGEVKELIKSEASRLESPLKIIDYSCNVRVLSKSAFSVSGRFRAIRNDDEKSRAGERVSFSADLIIKGEAVKVTALHCFIRSSSRSAEKLRPGEGSKSNFEQEILARERRLNNMLESSLKNLERFRTAIEATTDLVFEYDVMSENLTIDENKFCGLYNVTLDELTYEGICRAILDKIHPDDKKEFLKFSKNCLESAEVNGIDYRVKNFDEEYIWFRTNIVPVSFVGNYCDHFIFQTNNINVDKMRLLKLRRLSRIDGLTELLNRRTFEVEVDRFLSNKKEGGALIVLDVDDFKKINDTCGHIEGDRVLKELAQRISGVCGADDLVGRLGGDEFAVFLKYMEHKPEVAGKIEQIINVVFQTKYDKDSQTVTASVGASFVGEEDECRDILVKADQAMYRVKRDGKDGYSFDGEDVITKM